MALSDIMLSKKKASHRAPWARRHLGKWRLWGKEDGSLLDEEFELGWVQGPTVAPVPEEEEEEEEGAPFRTPREPRDGCPSPDSPSWGARTEL